MVNCSLRWSRLEVGFVGSCHLAAAVSALQIDSWVWLSWALTTAVLCSFLLYLRDRIQTFYKLGQGGLEPAQPELLLAQQFARIDYRASRYETALPRVVFMSEFLLVLSLHYGAVGASRKALYLSLWPDSMRRGDACRLRRYLRFELPEQL